MAAALTVGHAAVSGELILTMTKGQVLVSAQALVSGVDKNHTIIVMEYAPYDLRRLMIHMQEPFPTSQARLPF